MSRVPAGSMWRVRGSDLLRTKDSGLYHRELCGSTEPEPPMYVDGATNRFVPIPTGTVLLVGETVKRTTGSSLQHYQEFVRILMPFHCYLNRTYFNAGMDALERVS